MNLKTYVKGRLLELIVLIALGLMLILMSMCKTQDLVKSEKTKYETKYKYITKYISDTLDLQEANQSVDNLTRENDDLNIELDSYRDELSKYKAEIEKLKKKLKKRNVVKNNKNSTTIPKRRLKYNSFPEIAEAFKRAKISFFYNVINYDTEYLSHSSILNLNLLLSLSTAHMFLTTGSKHPKVSERDKA